MKTKKILMLFICAALLVCSGLTAFAEDTTPTEETATPTEEASSSFDWLEVKDTVSGYIVGWVQKHPEEVSVCVTLIIFVVNSIFRARTMNKNMSVLNNNAVTIAKNSSESMGSALAMMQDTTGAVTGYDARITALLAEFAQTAQGKQALEAEMAEIKKYLQISAEANIEFSNELAELLALANIPNYKKEEIGARHAAQLKRLRELGADAPTAPAEVEIAASELTEHKTQKNTQEVVENDGEEA